MKSYTNIEQSKILAKILPLESADMYYFLDPTPAGNIYHLVVQQIGFGVKTREPEYDRGDIPCWSLAALLEEIPSITVNNVGEDLKLHIDKDNLQYSLFYENEYTGDMFEIETELYDNMIDACYELILKLYELKML